MIVLLKQNEPYRVVKILLVNKEPVVNPIARSEKKGTEWSVPENIPKYKIAAKMRFIYKYFTIFKYNR